MTIVSETSHVHVFKVNTNLNINTNNNKKTERASKCTKGRLLEAAVAPSPAGGVVILLSIVLVRSSRSNLMREDRLTHRRSWSRCAGDVEEENKGLCSRTMVAEYCPGQ